MIGRLTGRIVECEPGSVLVDVAGVGYSLQIPLGTYSELVKRANGTVSLHVHTHVREDALQLFGFCTAAERAVFEQLLSISGVGPRMALAVLSGIGVEDLERAVLEGDRERLQRIPGVGRKTADRILLELRDRLERRAGSRGAGTGGRAAGSEPSDETDGLRLDAVSALQNLGYGRAAAGKAVEAAVAASRGRTLTLEAVLRAALRGLVQPGKP
jgi:Holliday junction DNA helicase RuvA